MNNIKEGVTLVVQRLVDKHGGITAPQLVEAARPKDSPAHDGFEWNNFKAGTAYRLIQSRNWIRSVEVVYEQRIEKLYHVPPAKGDGGSEGVYRSTSVLVSIPDEVERALSEAMRSLHAARRTVTELQAAIERSPSPDRSAMVVQVARGLQIMEAALDMVH